MPNYIKGSIQYQPVVEQVNRKFVPRKQTCTKGVTVGPVKIETQGWMGGGTRTTGRGGIGSVRKNYLIIRSNARATQPGQEELENRGLFVAANAGMRHIVKDLSQIAHLQQMWHDASTDRNKRVNGVSAYGYTYNGWIMAVQYAGKKEDDEYDVNTFPQDFDE